MSISKCEKWIYENHRTILCLVFIVSMYFVCQLKLNSKVDSDEPQTFLAFFGNKHTRPQLDESNSPQPGSFHRTVEALRLIPAFGRSVNIRRDNFLADSGVKSEHYVRKPDYNGHGSTNIFSHGIRSRHGFDSNAFEKFIMFLTPSSVRCRSPSPSTVKNLLFDETGSRSMRDQGCFDRTKCGAYDVDKKPCQDFHSHVDAVQFPSRKISPRLSASSGLSRFVPKEVWNILLDKLGHSAKHFVRNVDLHIDESLSFLKKIKELRVAPEREMELNLHLNFSGLNTSRKHSIVEQFLQSATHALHPRVLVRSSLPPDALRRLLHTEGVGRSAAVTLKTKWDRRDPNTENENFRIGYFNNFK